MQKRFHVKLGIPNFISYKYLFANLKDIYLDITNLECVYLMKKILVSLPEGVFKVIRDLKGEVGESDSEVVRNIVVAYLSEQGYFSRISVMGTTGSRSKISSK